MFIFPIRETFWNTNKNYWRTKKKQIDAIENQNERLEAVTNKEILEDLTNKGIYKDIFDKIVKEKFDEIR